MAAVAAVSAARARAAGTLVEVAPEQFVAIANRLRGRDTMVVHGRLGLRARTHVYVTGVHGLIFYCKTDSPLPITIDVEARKIHIMT